MIYTCARCKQVFESDWPEEEAIKEFKDNFGEDEEVGEDTAIICDDCYKEFMEWYDTDYSEVFRG